MKYEDIRRDLAALPPDGGEVEQTARTLEGMNWVPEFLYHPPRFLRFTRSDLLAEAERTLGMDDEQIDVMIPGNTLGPERARYTQVSLLIHHWVLLSGLRRGDPESWDRVNELYEDD